MNNECQESGAKNGVVEQKQTGGARADWWNQSKVVKQSRTFVENMFENV